MLHSTIPDILAYLNQEGFNAQFQAETNQIYLIFKIHDQDFPLFLRVIEESGLLQLLIFMPCRLIAKKIPDLARLLHLLNKELDVPGFGLDEISQIVFYRAVLAAGDKKIDETILKAYLNSMKMISEAFFPLIAALLQGSATFENILKQAKEKSV